MLYVKNDCLNPWYNLALEEYLLRRKDIDEDILCLWQNANSIIIGRHQNVVAQINMKAVDKYQTKIARRMTGGGAVYHDLGNLNYTYITSYKDGSVVNFKTFANPVINALKQYGVNAELSGRNDILVDGKKISGTAQAGIGNRLLFHGTIMYDVNVAVLSKVLHVDREKIRSKGIDSVTGRVTNLKSYLPQNIGIEELKKAILHAFLQNDRLTEFIIDEKAKKEILFYEQNQYRTEKWIFGESREGEISRKKRFAGGELEVLVKTDNGVITNCVFFGDYLGIFDSDDIARQLEGKLYTVDCIREELKKYQLNQYFGDITMDEILSCIF